MPKHFFNPREDVDVHTNRLPHWQQGDVYCFVTWRLGDSIPREILNKWSVAKEVWLIEHPLPWDDQTEMEYHETFSTQIDEWLDQGMGQCILRNPDLNQVVADAFFHFDQARYDVSAFVVMPNHVHILFRPIEEFRIPEIIQSWKGFTSRKIQKHRNRPGQLWQADYFDRLIRSESHFQKCVGYIRENPAKAGLKNGEFVLYVKGG